MTKSYVSLETNICPVCGVEFETNSILLDSTLRESMERKSLTGYSLCKQHQQEFEDGYLHLVVADSPDKKGNLLKIEEAIYTGEIISVKRDILKKLIDKDIDDRIPFVYIEPQAAAVIKELAGIKDQRPDQPTEE
jgi:hypothetical protein